MGEKGPASYKKSSKAHANMFKTFFTNVFRKFGVLYQENQLESYQNSCTFEF